MKTSSRALSALMLGLSLCGGFVTTTAHAAPAKPAAKGAAKPGAAKKKAPNPMFKAVGATPDQQKKIGAIQTAQRKQVKALQADKKLSAADKKKKVAAARKAGNDKVMALMTADQKKKFAAFRKEMAAKNKAKAATAKKKA